jgi:argininosuccinate lyase
VMSGLIATLIVRPERTRAAIGWTVLATDVADYLVRRGVPFRTAHSATGQAVRRAEELGIALPKLPLAEWQAIHPAFDTEVADVFDVDKAMERRVAWGGTAPQAVAEQLALAKEILGFRPDPQPIP